MSDEEEYELIPEEQVSTKQKFLNQFDANYPRPKNKVTRNMIGGLEKILEQIDDFALAFDNAELYDVMGVPRPTGILFHGPPGTGKTYLGRYLAGRLDARFLTLNLEMFESKWVGQAEDSLKKILNRCRTYHGYTNERVFLFMDELDDIYKSRRFDGYHHQRVNMLNREMDGLEDSDCIVFGGATNHLERVDSAALRPGRFDYLIEIKDYDRDALVGVSRALAVSFNSRSMYNPFRIRDREHEEIGSIAVSKCLLPADIKAVYRRAAEDKIKRQVYSQKMGFEEADYMVYGENVLEVLNDYERKTDGHKVVGFKGY